MPTYPFCQNTSSHLQANSTVTSQSTTSGSLSLLLCPEPLSLTLYTSIKLPQRSPYLNDAEASQITVIVSERCQVVRHGSPLKPHHSSFPSSPHAVLLHSSCPQLMMQDLTQQTRFNVVTGMRYSLCVAKKCGLHGNNNQVYESFSVYVGYLSICVLCKRHRQRVHCGSEDMHIHINH